MLNLKNTLDGYLKNVEVIGNTIQDENNLADIRSVGDKVEGQELYNISMQVDNGEGVSDVVEILSPVQLEKVGDVADRIICKDGVWGIEKYIVTEIFDGVNRNWILGGWNKENTITFDYRLTNFTFSSSLRPMSDRFVGKARQDVYSTTDEEYITASGAPSIFINIKKSRLSTVNVDGLLEWFSKNPTIIKYPSTQPQFIPLPHDQQVKLRTFAGQTNIAFLTEIPGQIKAQVPKSLGATVNTHTEQIKDLHNSLERVKKLEETTVSTVETESNFTTVDATSNGYFEDVKLEGKTLVDRTDIFNKVNPTGVDVYQKTNNSLIVDYSKCGEIDKARSLDETNVFKSGQIYTIIIDILQNTLNRKVEFYPMIWDFATVISGTQFVSVGEIGRKIFVIKANKDYSLKLAYASPGHATQGVTGLVEFKDIMVLDGDYTNKELPSYFEGLMSVGQDVEEVSVESRNRNLLNVREEPSMANYVNYIVNGDDSVTLTQKESNTNGKMIGWKFLAKSNTKYRLSGKFTNPGGNSVYLRVRDVKNNIAQYNSREETSREGYATLEFMYNKDTEVYVMAYFSISGTTPNSNSVVTWSNIQLSVASKDLAYTPYQTNKKPLLYFNPTTETWEKPILREWDTIEKHSDGKYYYHKRSGEVVLNGSAVIEHIDTTTYTNINYVRISISDMISKHNSPLICDNFKNEIYSTDKDYEYIYSWVQNSKPTLYINFLKSKASSKTEFQQWLQANNVTVVYQLAQEEVYECTSIDLMTYSGETNYIINSGAISPKSLLKVHNNISNVVKILQEKVSLLENTFIAGLKSVLSGDMYSLATILYPEDFEQNDNTEQDIMVIPE